MVLRKTKLIMVQSFPLSWSESFVRLEIFTGLELARLADLPNDVLIEANRVSKYLTELQTRHQEQSDSTKIAMRRKALLRVCMFWCPYRFWSQTASLASTSFEQISRKLLNTLRYPMKSFWHILEDFKGISQECSFTRRKRSNTTSCNSNRLKITRMSTQFVLFRETQSVLSRSETNPILKWRWCILWIKNWWHSGPIWAQLNTRAWTSFTQG